MVMSCFNQIQCTYRFIVLHSSNIIDSHFIILINDYQYNSSILNPLEFGKD